MPKRKKSLVGWICEYPLDVYWGWKGQAEMNTIFDTKKRAKRYGEYPKKVRITIEEV